MWARLSPLLPSSEGLPGRHFRDHRLVLEGIIFRQRTGCAWRDLPADFGPWQTGVEAARPVQPGRHLGPDLDRAADRRGRRGRAGLDRVGGLDGGPGAPARDEPDPAGAGGGPVSHRGLYQITRIRSPSQLIMQSGGPAAV